MIVWTLITLLTHINNPCLESLQGKHWDDKGLGYNNNSNPRQISSTVTLRPVLLLGSTCHITTVFAQLKIDCF